jgi:hypothetical protein
MRNDKRNLVEVLTSELEFLEKGGYRHPARAAWRPQFVFQDSPTCLNSDSTQHPRPCTDCTLMQLVPADSQARKFPCRYIPLNERGDTLDSLYRSGTQEETESALTEWLKARIARLEPASGEERRPDESIQRQ